MRSLLAYAVTVDADQVLLTISRTNRAEASPRLTNCTPRRLGMVPEVTVLQEVPLLLCWIVYALIRAESSLRPNVVRLCVGDHSRWLTARRSEEHTSELQSRENLVCRLLLEKKKKKMS